MENNADFLIIHDSVDRFGARPPVSSLEVTKIFSAAVYPRVSSGLKFWTSAPGPLNPV